MTDHDEAALPRGWSRVTVDEVLAPLHDGRTLHQGWSPQCESGPAGAGEWGVLKTTAVQAGRFDGSHNKRLPSSLEPRPHIEVRQGDLVMTCAGPRSRCGVPALVRSTPGRLMLSGKIYRFRADERLVLAPYLEYFLLSPDGQAQIEVMKTGISDSGLNLTRGRFFTLQVPVPPVAEQRRIVAEAERRLSHIDAAATALTAAERRTHAARRSVIHELVTGGCPTSGKPVPPLVHELAMTDTAGLPEVPKQWVWVRLSDALAEPMRNGKSAPTAPEGTGVRIYSITVVTQRDFGLHNSKWAQGDAESLRSLHVRDGDIFVQRSNTPELVGSAALYRGPGTGAIFPDLLIRVRPSPVLLPEWLELVLRWSHTRRYLRSVASGLAGSMPKIDQAKLGNVPVPVPPLDEQRWLVAEADRRLSLIDGAEAATHQMTKRIGQLRRAVLADAFAGRLAPQDPNDEPAMQLLERIRAKRAASTPAKRTRRRRAPQETAQ